MNYKKSEFGIKTWAEEDRPREKLLLQGKSNLTNAELIAILLGSGTRSISAVSLAKEILAKYDQNLHLLAKANMDELQKFKGVGQAKAISIMAAMELGRRKLNSQIPTRVKITSSRDAFDILGPSMKDERTEVFKLLLLNRSNQVIQEKLLSKGGIAGTVVDPKIIFKMALDKEASSIILSHNHPSGNLSPSNSDIQITKKLVEAGKFLEISVLDHLIISENGYLSFADEGLI